MKKHLPLVVWLYGLSGSGKTTLANEIELILKNNSIHTIMLDGDNLRQGLCGDLGFSANSRRENLRRAAEVSSLMYDAGLVCLSSFITPTETFRSEVRSIIGLDRMLEVYVKCDLSECEVRDVKGLYKKARNGDIKGFTGVSSPFEEPVGNSFLVVDTKVMSIEDSVNKILNEIMKRIIKKG